MARAGERLTPVRPAWAAWSWSWAWLHAHDPNLAATRRATRTALVMPALYLFSANVFHDAAVTTFAAFGSFALLLLADVRGTTRQRVETTVALTVAGAALVCLGTLVSQSPWSAAATAVAVGFAVLLSGVISSVVARTSTSLLLAFILPVMSAGGVSSIPARLLGWGMAGAAALAAVCLLWPPPENNVLRDAVVACCRELSARVHRLVVERTSRPEPAVRSSTELRAVFYAGALRPAELGTDSRTVIRLVDKLTWLDSLVSAAANDACDHVDPRLQAAVDDVRSAVAEALDRVGQALASSNPSLRELICAQRELHHRSDELLACAAYVALASSDAPAQVTEPATARRHGVDVRARELAVAADLVLGNAILTVRAGRRGVRQRVLGRTPLGVRGPLRTIRDRLVSHLHQRSIWLHNSVRGAVGLGAAVLLADLSHAQHSFWIVLGTVSVLSSSASSTGRNILRSLLGTTAGMIAGGVVVVAASEHPALLWALLPVSIVFAGIAPAVISFAAGQAGFTLTLIVLANIAAPVGWRVGVVRLQDIAIGVLVSLVVGGLLWPRGATPRLATALADAYAAHARYLGDAVRCAVGDRPWADPGFLPSRAIAAAASSRLDDTLREARGEQAAAQVTPGALTKLVEDVSVPRLTGDAILDLWNPSSGARRPDDTSASELVATAAAAVQWYTELADALAGKGSLPAPPVTPGLRPTGATGTTGSTSPGGTVTATRLRWTAGHLATLSAHQKLLSTLTDAVTP